MTPNVIMAGGNNCTQSLWCTYQGFERAGCSVRHVPTSRNGPGGKMLRAEGMAALMAALPDANLLYWWQPQSNMAPIEFMREIRAKFPKLKTVCHSLDDPFTLDDNPGCEVFGEFHVGITCCEGSKPWYEERGVKPMVGYPPCDRDFNGLAAPKPAEQCDLSFAATNVYPQERYPKCLADRAAMVRAVSDVGKLHLYGTWGEKGLDWGSMHGLSEQYRPAFKGHRAYEDMPGVYAASRINLNSHVRPDGYRYLNERITQGMSSGGFMLCDRVSGIEEIFIENLEIVLWRNLEELRDKARWWLRHEAERRCVATAGRRVALELFDNEKLARSVLTACEQGD